MNEYEFEFECETGWYSTYRTWAPNKLQAYENLIDYLKECNLDPENTRIFNCYVAVAEGEEGNETLDR